MTMEAFTKTVPLILCNKITALCARALLVSSPVIQARAPASMMVSLSAKTSSFPPLMGATRASAAERKSPAQRKTAVSWILSRKTLFNENICSKVHFIGYSVFVFARVATSSLIMPGNQVNKLHCGKFS